MTITNIELLLNSYTIHFLKKIGIDRAVTFTVLGKVWHGIAGILTIWIIARFLSPEEQGFYFTFASILTLQVFVELGLSMVLLQFASHEKAHLQWTEGEVLSGNHIAKERLSSLIKLTIKWYGIASLLVILCILPAGYYFFLKNQVKYSGVIWQLPWIFLILSFSMFFFVVPFLSILEGCGKVKDVAKLRFKQGIIANLLLWIGLVAGWGLFAASLVYIGGFVVISYWMGNAWRKDFFKDMLTLKAKQGVKISWRQEIFPFQWKIALSWISGFFIFALFNPVLFAYHGAKIAGQMGLTLTAYNGITIISMAWINTKVPAFGGFIAKKEFNKLDSLFFRVLWQSLTVVVLLTIIFIGIVYLLQTIQHPIGDRFLPSLPILLLGGVTVINHIVFAQAAYLRAHKQEPFLLNSVIGGILMAFSTYFLGKWYGAFGAAAGYFFLALIIGLSWATWIFISKRRQWHQGEKLI